MTVTVTVSVTVELAVSVTVTVTVALALAVYDYNRTLLTSIYDYNRTLLTSIYEYNRTLPTSIYEYNRTLPTSINPYTRTLATSVYTYSRSFIGCMNTYPQQDTVCIYASTLLGIYAFKHTPCIFSNLNQKIQINSEYNLQIKLVRLDATNKATEDAPARGPASRPLVSAHPPGGTVSNYCSRRPPGGGTGSAWRHLVLLTRIRPSRSASSASSSSRMRIWTKRGEGSRQLHQVDARNKNVTSQKV